METIQIEIEQEGMFVLPTVLRQKYQLRPGDIFRIIDFDGTFVLVPNNAEPSDNDLHYKAMVPKLAEEISQIVAESGYTTEELLVSLREERAKYYEEHYAKR